MEVKNPDSAGHIDQITGGPLCRRQFIRALMVEHCPRKVEPYANFIWQSTEWCPAHRKSDCRRVYRVADAMKLVIATYRRFLLRSLVH